MKHSSRGALSWKRSGTGEQTDEGDSWATEHGPEAEEEESRDQTQGY